MQGIVVARDHCDASSSNQGSFRKKCLVSWPFKSHDVNTYTNKYILTLMYLCLKENPVVINTASLMTFLW